MCLTGICLWIFIIYLFLMSVYVLQLTKTVVLLKNFCNTLFKCFLNMVEYYEKKMKQWLSTLISTKQTTITQHKKQDNIISCWKSRSGVGQAQQYGRVKPINGIPTFPLWYVTMGILFSLATPRYSWNTAKVGVNHQSINQE